MSLSILPDLAAVFVLIFARLGTMLMLMPALGDAAVPARIRLAAALAVTLVLFPFARTYYGTLPAALGPLAWLLACELVVGFGLGLAARMMLSGLAVAGNVIAIQLGLGFVSTVDPTQGDQNVIVANFLTLAGVTLILATDLHHLFIAALRDSYILFRPGELLPSGDLAQLALEIVAEAFRIGLQVTTPFLVFGLLFYVGLGVLSRLMPQLQIFFIAVPANILFGFLILALVLGSLLTWFLGGLEASAVRFLVR
jgi:flagellar biosynthetic protein FliR